MAYSRVNFNFTLTILFEWGFKWHPKPPLQYLDTACTAIPSVQAVSFITSGCCVIGLHYGTGYWDITLLHKSDYRPTRVFIETGWHHSRHSAGCACAHFTGTGLHSVPSVRTKEERNYQVHNQRHSSSQVSTDTVLYIDAVSSISCIGLPALL